MSKPEEAAFVGHQAGRDPLPRGLRPWRASEADMAWWMHARLGMMIHFGVSAVEGVELSWGRALPRPFDIQDTPLRDGVPGRTLSHEDYDALHLRFDPDLFDADRIVATALEMGAGYLVVTAKHHDGFCMWDTAETEYRITATTSPFRRDVIGELAEACHRAGMPFGVYYSQRDWHQPDYLRDGNGEYQRYMDTQLRELLTRYGRVDVVWFDSYGQSDLLADWDPHATIRLIKELQPHALINNRLAVLAEYNQGPPELWGDFDTPEQRLGELQTERPWESCVTLAGGQWSWRPDTWILPLSETIRMLVTCAVRDGNLLLNVGPTDRGVIDPAQRDRLREIGEWMARYGESVRGTRAWPVAGADWGGATRTDEEMFVHVLQWPAGGLQFVAPFPVEPEAEVLTGGAVRVVTDGRLVAIEWSAGDLDGTDTILRLRARR